MGGERSSVWEGLRIGPGSMADYAALKDFHYRSGRPGAVTRVFVARYCGPGVGGEDAVNGMRAGVIVEALPSLGCTLRSIALPGRFQCGNRSLNAACLNREMRTIARVVVHPIFRSVGLAVELVKHLLQRAETPYIEALAAMGRVNPFFERAGMKAFDRPALPEVVRLMAALESQGLSAMDLATRPVGMLSPFLIGEMRRFARGAETVEACVAMVRRRLLSQPVYYVWEKGTDNERHGDSEYSTGTTGAASAERQRDAGGGDEEAAATH